MFYRQIVFESHNEKNVEKIKKNISEQGHYTKEFTSRNCLLSYSEC